MVFYGGESSLISTMLFMLLPGFCDFLLFGIEIMLEDPLDLLPMMLFFGDLSMLMTFLR